MSYKFDIKRSAEPGKSFRVASVIGKFDLSSNKIEEHFVGEINQPDKWNIGLIVGPSGTGKTTIAKELFPKIYDNNFKYKAECILDDMPKEKSVEEISKAFNSVGFSSPPSWLKPYSALSNGEKMRVDLARLILSEQKLFLFDEFTSVVDRQVAQVGSFAIQKAIRKADRQFIAISCHYDIEEWLMPDWVFNTKDMTFRIASEKQKKNRPGLKFTIQEIEESKTKSEYWKIFSKYHYLSHSHNNAARVFIAEVNGVVAGFISVIHFPHPKVKNYKNIHRLVILPDYQGLGIGKILLNTVADIVKKEGKRVGITTSAPSLIFSLKKDPNWACKRFGRCKPHGGRGVGVMGSYERITVSFEYNPPKIK
jgi:ABC-type Mn2+/Zn2+ transport system ATPase subunit